MDRRAGLRDSSGREIMALKLKITSHYINDITSPVILSSLEKLGPTFIQLLKTNSYNLYTTKTTIYYNM